MLAVKLERGTKPEVTRLILFDVDEDTGMKLVEDIMECDCEHSLWHHLHERHPGIGHVMVDGEPVESDCLTLREAAEAEFYNIAIAEG